MYPSSHEEDGSSNPLGSEASSSASKPSLETVRGVRQTVVNLADRIALYNLGNGEASVVQGVQYVYLLTPFDVPIKLDTNKTLGKVFLGLLGVRFNTFYKRNIWIGITLSVLWFLGVIVSFLSIISVLPQYLAWSGILTLPTLVFGALLMQYDIVVHLCQRFSTQYCFGNILIESICLTWLFQGDIRSIIPIGGIFSLMFCLFFDALPPKLRAGGVAPMMVIGILWLLALQTSLFFNLYNVKPQELNLGSIVITASSTFTSSTINLSIYLTKNLYTTVMHPRRYTVKTSRMILRLLEKREADDIQAMDYILHQKIRMKKEEEPLWLKKVMEVDTHIQEVLIRRLQSKHPCDGIKGENVIAKGAREVIEEYLQSKMKSLKELIKKESAAQHKILASSSSSNPAPSIKIVPHILWKEPSSSNSIVNGRPTIISRAHELESITRGSLGDIDDTDDTFGVYLTYAVMPSRIIENVYKKEVGEVFFGSLGKRISKCWVTSPTIQTIFIVSGAMNLVLSLLVCADLLPWWILIFLGLTIVPVSFFIGLTLQIELCSLLVFRFETILGYLFILQTAFGLSWTFSNFKMIAPIFVVPWFLLLLFCDAMGPRGRPKITKFGITLGTIWCIGMFIGIYFNWFPGVTSKLLPVLGLRFTSTSTACGGLIQMMILSLKNMYVTLHYENSLAVIHSPIETTKVNRRIADLIIAGRLASDRAIHQRMNNK
jgi:hypothetical protein